MVEKQLKSTKKELQSSYEKECSEVMKRVEAKAQEEIKESKTMDKEEMLRSVCVQYYVQSVYTQYNSNMYVYNLLYSHFSG